MDVEVATVAEQLAGEFNDLPGDCVVDTIEHCRGDYPNSSSHFILQAARARLCQARNGRS